MSNPWGDDPNDGNSWASRLGTNQPVRPKAKPSDPNTAPQQWPSLASAAQTRSGGTTPAGAYANQSEAQFGMVLSSTHFTFHFADFSMIFVEICLIFVVFIVSIRATTNPATTGLC